MQVFIINSFQIQLLIAFVFIIYFFKYSQFSNSSPLCIIVIAACPGLASSITVSHVHASLQAFSETMTRQGDVFVL